MNSNRPPKLEFKEPEGTDVCELWLNYGDENIRPLFLRAGSRKKIMTLLTCLQESGAKLIKQKSKVKDCGLNKPMRRTVGRPGWQKRIDEGDIILRKRANNK